MLGFTPLGVLALGELPRPKEAAQGAILELELTLLPGRATGEREEAPPSFVTGGRGWLPRYYDAVAPGALLVLEVALLPGRAFGVIAPPAPPPAPAIDAAAPGAVIDLQASILVAGNASGDTIEYDNSFLLAVA